MVKDVLREIKKKWFQFVAIMIITALGVGFFVGIQVTGYNMRITGDDYTRTNEILDFYLSTTLGVDDIMIETLEKELDAKVFGEISGDAFIHRDDFDHVVHAFRYTQDTAVDLTLTEGELPSNDGEVVLDAVMAQRLKLELGDTFTLEKSDVLKSQELVVVGLGNSSLYFNQDRGQSKLGRLEGFIYVQGLETKDDIYTGVRVIAEEGVEPESLRTTIELIKDDLITDRYHRIVDPIIADLETAQVELNDAKAQVNQEFDDAWNEIIRAEMSLTDAKNEIINGVLELNPETQWTHYIDYYENSLLYFENLKVETQATFDETREQIMLIPDANAQALALAELEAEIEGFNESMVEVDRAHASLAEGIASIEQGSKELLDAKSVFQQKKKEALEELDQAQADIDEGFAKIDDTDTGSFYILDRDAVIIGYSAYYDDSKRIESIGQIFPLVFFGVAILVTLSTITRMIEESRVEIGIYKALGYSRFRTTLKFTGFTFFSWLFGSAVGLFIGFGFIPVLIYNAYRIMYMTPELKIGFITSYAWIPLLMSFVTSVGIAFVKAQSVAKETTATLLMPPSPKGGQRVFLERFGFIWNRLSFLYKVSLRNLFRNKTRFMMTVVGIGGCCGLLITGFGIQYSINSIVDKQFDDIIQYDAVVAFEKGFDSSESVVNDTVFIDVGIESVSVDNNDVSIYAVNDLAELGTMISFRDRLSGKPLTVSNKDVIITEKLAIMNNISIGDTLQFNEGDRVHEVVVTQITENYVAHYIYMSTDMFKETMGYSISPSIKLLQLGDVDEDVWAQELRAEDHVLSVNVLHEMKVTYREMMGSFDIVILVIVIAAFALQVVVLLNLITMNMSERYKELATLKVLGFYPKELSSYVLRENVILSLISLVVGVFFGAYLHRFVLLSAEIDMIMFNRILLPSAVLWACILTLALSIAINLFMSRRANNVNMAEALKSQ